MATDNSENKQVTREFGISTLAVNNKISVFIIMFIIVAFGLISYNSMPKEQFPEITIPTVYINAPYPGNSPLDIENLITRPIEKELKSVNNVKKITSTSSQDIGVVVVEFNEGTDITKALTETKDAVDKAKKELPEDLDTDPMVQEVDVSEIPIMVINISGDYEIDQLNDYAEWLEDKIEEISEVSKVEITGAVEREIQINADVYQMEARMVTFDDIANAIAAENMSMSGGDVKTLGYRRSLRVDAEFKTIDDIANIIVKAEDGNTIYLSDVAEVVDTYEERNSYARLATKKFAEQASSTVISLKVVKKSGENLINADRKIRELLEEAVGDRIPADLNIVLTDNQADKMQKQVDNLENSIISGVILVVLVLLFFMGLRNALFVGIAIPLSMFMAFIILGATGNTINIMVLFALILALGMLVDNAIVVIENIYRLNEQGMSNDRSAREGVGEVAVAIISSTATTLADFLPLAFWGGTIGEFMKFLPITLIVVLTSSLFVGLVINPVLAAQFMTVQKGGKQNPSKKKWLTILALSMITVAIPLYFAFSSYAVPNLLVFFAIISLLNAYFFKPAAHWFQTKALVRLEQVYLRTLRYALSGKRPYLFFGATFAFLILSIGIFVKNEPEVVLFPDNEPSYVYLYIEAPLGTDVENMNRVAEQIESRIYDFLEPYARAVESVVTNVGKGTGDSQDIGSSGGGNITPHKVKFSVGFVDYEDRDGVRTSELMKELADVARQIPGVKVSTGKDSSGPPTGKAISIEVTGEDYLTLIEESERLKQVIDQSDISGIEALSLELEVGKPELLVNIDRERARNFGLSTSMVASSMRTAIYGREVSKFKDGEDDYPIQLRLAEKYRYDLSALQDKRMTFRDKKGKFHQIPISAVAKFEYSTTFGSVRRKDMNRLITISSNVEEGFNPNEVVGQIKNLLQDHKMADGYSFKFGGEQEDQQESIAFLQKAFLIAISAIFLILVSQFNSAIKPFIIMLSVLFSLIGVLLGITGFGDQFVIIMTGVGIISLAGVVVNNAIVLIDYIDLTRERRKEELGLPAEGHLGKEDFRNCLVEGGYTRLRPVLLTAITTVLGLIPLATGFNIDFYGLFSSFSPSIYWGGENADFWGPMAWTVIYGLVFATFLTLVIVPVMYSIADDLAQFTRKTKEKAAEVV